MTSQHAAVSGALAGVTVLDLSRVLAGPLCTQTLADLGATVWKVEPPGGDDTRGWGPPFVGEDAAYFLAANRGKQSLAVDLKHPEGAELVADLAATADVLVENFKVGDLERYGLAYEQVAATNPGIVYTSITGYGQSGPRATEPGYDLVMQAMTGLMDMTGPADGDPARVGVALIDVLTAQSATVAVLAALRQRDVTGRGQHLDLALFDVGLASMVNVAQSALVTGTPPTRWGSGHPSIVPYQAFPTADGDVAIAVGNDAQFRRLCRVIERADLAGDRRWATNAERVEHREELVEELTAAFAVRPTGDWLARLDAAGVPAAPVRDVAAALDDPQTAHRGLRWPMSEPLGDRGRPAVDAEGEVLGSPLGALGAHARGRRPPRLGEHTRTVLQAQLGLSPQDVDRLVAAGALVDGVRR